MKERLKSKVVWLGVLAQVVMLIALVNPYFAEEVKIVVTAILEIATLFGILNNPTTREEF